MSLSLPSQQVFGMTYTANEQALRNVLPAPSFSDHVVTNFAALKGSSQQFELAVGDGLLTFGVKPFNMVWNLEDNDTKTQADLGIYSVKRRRPIFVMVKTSCRERWKQEDRSALNIHDNKRLCVDRMLPRLGNRCGIPLHYSSSTPPEVWVVFYQERAHDTVADSIAHAKKYGSYVTGMDGDKFITAFDTKGMNRLLNACL